MKHREAGVALRARVLDRVHGELFHLDARGRILYLNEVVRRGLVARVEDPDAVEVLPSDDGVTLSLRDITEPVEGEAELRSSEERYRAPFERLHLPASAGPLVQAVTEAAEEGEVTGGSEAILLVEDEAVVRDLASRVLRRLGYRVTPASGPEEALQRLEGPRAVGIHLLVTDVVMPGMTGPALATRVRSLVPGVVVLYTSGYARETLSRGADRVVDGPFLPKPFGPAELARAVRSALDGGAGGAGGGQDVRPRVS